MLNWLRRLMGLPIPGEPFKRHWKDQEIIDKARAEYEAFMETYVPPTEMKPHDKRIHEAALDKDFPEKRKVAVSRINAALKTALVPAGFTHSKGAFTRAIGNKKGIVRLERSRYGYEAMITVTIEGPATMFGTQGPKTVRLHEFMRKEELPPMSEGGSGWIEYLMVYQDAAAMDPHIKLLMERALPWLMAHAANRSPDVSEFRKLV
ncbi:MAG: hypothetical protein ACRC6I_00790 [Paracoccaceae bacterium]